jgi:HEAT repeat protein
VVAARVRDEQPAVRTAALELIARFELGASMAEEVRLCLRDSLAANRLVALRAWTSSDVLWHDDARAALHDPDEQVALTAMLALAKAGALGDAALVELIASPVSTIRETALTIARGMPSPVLLDTLLPIARAEQSPDTDALQALAGQIRSGAGSDEQCRAALDVVLQRMALAQPVDLLTFQRAVGAFVHREPRALALLLGALRDGDPVRRFQATSVLGDEAGAEAIPALQQIADDPSMPQAAYFETLWSVGENARRSIARIEARVGLAMASAALP